MSAAAPSQLGKGRLQRPPDFTGRRLTRFREVWLRHGLPGLLLGVCLLAFVPAMWDVLNDALSPAAESPLRYGLALLGLSVGLALHSRWKLGQWRASVIGWIGYLGVLSLWEEWAFRFALPHAFQWLGLSTMAAIVLVNALFGAMHYVTLRWRWQWCLGAALGGLALSRSAALHDDLLWVAGLHWVATYLNTPRPPSVSSQ